MITFLQAIAPYAIAYLAGVLFVLVFYFVVCPLFKITVTDLDETGARTTIVRTRERMYWDAVLCFLSIPVATYYMIRARLQK